MKITALVDRLLPGPGSALDRASQVSHRLALDATSVPAAQPVVRLLHGNEVIGHPTHPVLIALPIGAWSVSAWHDGLGALTGDARHDDVADAALRFGIVTAVAAAVTGVVQYADTEDAVRRETAVHAALNSLALGMYVASAVLRARGRRAGGRRLAAAAVTVVGASGWLGGDISYRHGVGMRPQALRDPHLSPTETSEEPIYGSGSHHT